MGPQKRGNAVSTLKDALTRQFGEQARDLVEAHVAAQLSSSKGAIGRQDLDIIEQGILSSMRTLRGSTRSLKASQSAPGLSPGVSRSPQIGGARAPASPVKMPTVPIGTSNPGTVARSGSSPALPHPKLKNIRPAPFGLSITNASEFVDQSARSGVKIEGRARYPVPKPPMLKPLDHFDLMVAFDSKKYQIEEKEDTETGAYNAQMSFKKTLDDQMIEVQQGWDNDKAGKQEEADLMAAQIIENKRYWQEEEDILNAKKDAQSKVNESMMDGIYKNRKKIADRKDKECEEVTAWLSAEKDQRDEDERQQKIIYAKKCATAKANLEANRAERAERIRLDMENEKRLMKIRDQIADEQEAAKQKALQDRKDHIDKVAGTIGAAIEERDKKEASDLEAKIKRIQEESNRKAMEDARNKQEVHLRKVKEMLATRVEQIKTKHAHDGEELAQDKRQMVVFAADFEASKREDKEKEEKRRLAREEQDQTLIHQIRINAGIHPQHVMMTPRNRKTELGYNKAIFDQMVKEEFMVDKVEEMRNKPQRDIHPEGKLLPFPTIPRYTGEIHPIELEQPDV